jgi:hypothetical protein
MNMLVSLTQCAGAPRAEGSHLEIGVAFLSGASLTRLHPAAGLPHSRAQTQGSESDHVHHRHGALAGLQHTTNTHVVTQVSAFPGILP